MGTLPPITEKALHLLRRLPRVSLSNICDNPKAKQRVRIILEVIKITFENIIKNIYLSLEYEGKSTTWW